MIHQRNNDISEADRILDTALQLAEKGSWESLRLRHIADDLGISLEQIRRHFAQKDDLVEAWFDRADRAMLEDAAKADYLQLSTRERLQRSILYWLESLSVHHRISREMLYYKLEPGHVHLQVLGLLRISRTVQWMLEAARRDSVNLHRILEESALTSIYVTTFAHWLFDRSPGRERTRRYLDRRLRDAERVARWIEPLLGVPATDDTHRAERTG